MEKNRKRPLSNLQYVKQQKPIVYKSLEEKRQAKELEKIKEDMSKLTKENEEMIQFNNILNEKLSDYAKITEAQTELDVMEEEMRKLTKENEELKQSNDILNEKLIDCVKITDIEAELKVMKEKMNKLTKENVELKQSNIVLNEKVNEGVKINEVEAELKMLKEENSKMKIENADLKKLNTNLNLKIAEIISEDVDEGDVDEGDVDEEDVDEEDVDEGDADEINVDQEDETFTWTRIEFIPQYKAAVLILKKSEHKEKGLVKFIKENIYERKIKDFIRESMKLLFRKTFFMNAISYKHEVGRVSVKDSIILECLEESITNKFKGKKEKITGPLSSVIQNEINSFKRDVARNPLFWPDEE